MTNLFRGRSEELRYVLVALVTQPPKGAVLNCEIGQLRLGHAELLQQDQSDQVTSHCRHHQHGGTVKRLVAGETVNKDVAGLSNRSRPAIRSRHEGLHYVDAQLLDQLL